MANVDDVHNLLKAVNEVTLKRMEEHEEATLRVLKIIHDKLVGLEEKLGIPH